MMASWPFDSSGAVLLPIDMQRAIDWPCRPRRGNPALDENGLRLLASWREKGLPIVHVRHDSVEAESLFRPDHPGNALRPGFEPQAGGALVVKSVSSAFIRTGANMGWEMVMVADACDCMELPDVIGGGIIPASEVHRVHVATLAAEFCRAVGTA